MGCEQYGFETKKSTLWKSAFIHAFCSLIYLHQTFGTQRNDEINNEIRAVDGPIEKDMLLRWKRHEDGDDDDDKPLCPKVLTSAKSAMTKIITSCGKEKPFPAIDQSEDSFTLTDGKFYGMDSLIVNGSMNAVCLGSAIQFEAMLAMLNPRITYKFKTTSGKVKPPLEASVWMTAQQISMELSSAVTIIGKLKAEISPVTLRDTDGFHYGVDGEGKEPFETFIDKLENTVLVGCFKKAVVIAIEKALQKCADLKLVNELLLPNTTSKERSSTTMKPTTTTKQPHKEVKKISSTTEKSTTIAVTTTKKPVEKTSSSTVETASIGKATLVPPTLIIKDNTKDRYFERIIEEPFFVFDSRLSGIGPYMPRGPDPNLFRPPPPGFPIINPQEMAPNFARSLPSKSAFPDTNGKFSGMSGQYTGINGKLTGPNGFQLIGNSQEIAPGAMKSLPPESALTAVSGNVVNYLQQGNPVIGDVSLPIKDIPDINRKIESFLEKGDPVIENVSPQGEEFPGISKKIKSFLDIRNPVFENVSLPVEDIPDISKKIESFLEKEDPVIENVSPSVEEFPGISGKIRFLDIGNPVFDSVSPPDEENDSHVSQNSSTTVENENTSESQNSTENSGKGSEKSIVENNMFFPEKGNAVVQNGNSSTGNEKPSQSQDASIIDQNVSSTAGNENILGSENTSDMVKNEELFKSDD